MSFLTVELLTTLPPQNGLSRFCCYIQQKNGNLNSMLISENSLSRFCSYMQQKNGTFQIQLMSENPNSRFCRYMNRTLRSGMDYEMRW